MPGNSLNSDYTKVVWLRRVSSSASSDSKTSPLQTEPPQWLNPWLPHYWCLNYSKICTDNLPRNTMLASGSSIWYPNEVVVSCVRVLASNSTPIWIWRTKHQHFCADFECLPDSSHYPHYLLVGSVIIAGMGTSFSSIQCGYPVWSWRRKDRENEIKRINPANLMNIEGWLLEYCPAKVRIPPSSARPRW